MKNKKINVAIILAGGASERFGSCKYIEKIKDIPLIFYSLRPFLENYFKQNFIIIIVAGLHYEKIIDTIKVKNDPFFGYNIKILENDFLPNQIWAEDLVDKKEIKLFICKNENYQYGMFSSVKKGIKFLVDIYKNIGSKKSIKNNISSVVISLADMPFISSDIVVNLIKRLKSKFTDCIIPYTIIKKQLTEGKNKKEFPIEYELKTKKGHPIALKIGFTLKILKFDDNIILRDVLKTGKVKFYKTNDFGILFDIDRVEDLKNLDSFNIQKL